MSVKDRLRSVRSRLGPSPEPVVAPEAEVSPEQRWFDDHVDAARQIISFLAGDNLAVEGMTVADVGCGDGIIDLALAREGRPERLVGYDLNRTDTDHLLEQARRYSYADELPANLEFVGSETDHIPADDQSFDVLVSWSCFEHVSDPMVLATEMRRIVRDHGVLFLQLWPFYHSEHGSHLFDWYPDGFPHLTLSEDTIRARLLEEDVKPLSEYMWKEYQNLNQITLDELGEALYKGGFSLAKVELISHVTRIPAEIAHLPLSRLLVSGVKLLAIPRLL